MAPSNPSNPPNVVIRVGDTFYNFRPGEITARIARRVRQETGMSLVRAQELLAEQPDLDVFATVCFAAALQTDPARASLDEIDEQLSYVSEIEVTVQDAGEGDDGDPET